DIEKLKNELENDIKNKVIPFLNRFNDKKNILEQLFMERYAGFYELARIKVLYKNGFSAEIKNMISSENYQWKYKGIILEKINNWVKENG
ncbi:MAG: hypothetical protein LBT33_03200, partial [Spirochaetia bacterium]|nr:hypothetical protein [Spirochaetia bacterium]